MFENFLMIIFAGSIAWIVLQVLTGRRKSSTGARRRANKVSPFSAVSVRSGPKCCQAATAIKGRRFIYSEAPYLPLEKCTAQKCQCVYYHHADRRTGNGDRRALGAGAAFLVSQGDNDRRLGAGRREIDKHNGLSWT